ncbi:class I SAM-dependent methyltransferase [Pleionea litopenaei]|uniref:Class I SAM-dependent methyltransferase n=1 Tax=Pleionea litopenaei TaxID=3070815 RepID=A0AA51RT02_9GAMM|nr:class I SAM-dependent methyltransferase [Pleionea sp. HL-JVS1]WMS86939.1 class I SAM-dependent methyltransferase [Pleionea sp. HL-JVS1]
MPVFQHAFGDNQLERYPTTHDPSLLPWDHADHLLLQRTQQWLTTFSPQSINETEPQKHILVINDHFGALSCALALAARLTHWNDSYLSHKATEYNLKRNQLPAISGASSHHSLPAQVDLIIIRPTKNLSFYRQQLTLLAYLYPATPILIGIMQKFITTNLRTINENFVDNLNPGRAEKKARVLQGEMVSSVKQLPEEFSSFVIPPMRDVPSLIIANLPNVFSHQSLDIGARFLIEHFPRDLNVTAIADLGCGNGVLSIVASFYYPNSRIFGFDESYSAVRAAEETFRLNDRSNGQFITSNIFSEASEQKFDLILCNPPFHQQRRTTTDTAHFMFKQSLQKLQPNGAMIVVANRHLDYHKVLRKLFGNVTFIASNNKFVVLQSTFNPSEE